MLTKLAKYSYFLCYGREAVDLIDLQTFRGNLLIKIVK